MSNTVINTTVGGCFGDSPFSAMIVHVSLIMVVKIHLIVLKKKMYLNKKNKCLAPSRVMPAGDKARQLQ